MGSPRTGVGAARLAVAEGPACFLVVPDGAGHVRPLVAGCAAWLLVLVVFVRFLLVADAVSEKVQRPEARFAAGSREGR